MAKKNSWNIVIALILAILLWAYVVGQVNPTARITVKDLPIQVLNAEGLEAENMVILSKDVDTVDLQVTGQRTVLSELKPEDFTVTVDASTLGEGEYRVRLDVVGPEDIVIESLSVQTVKFIIEKIAKQSRPVTVQIVNDTSDKTEPYIIQLSPESVSVTGAQSMVDKVDHLRADLDAAKLSTEMQSYSVPLVPVDASGNQVEGITLSKDEVSVTALILDKKTVSLEVPIIGEESELYTRTVSVPKVITVKGIKSTLDKLDSVKTKTVDVNGIYENTTLDLVPLLPEGVEAATESLNLKAKVTVTGAKVKIFNLKASDVVIEGAPEGASVRLDTDKITITACGPAAALNEADSQDFKLSVDVSKLESGTHEVELILETEVTAEKITLEPKTVTVVME